MSKNIKEIGKELLGKSLNSYHRRTGLTQLEKNNEMQDGILNGILSQVDDAYIEKTEQSNVIHLDGSGDGVVVVDSIEGNTMVNIASNYFNNSIYTRNSDKSINIRQHDTTLHGHSSLNKLDLKRNTTYTLFTSVPLRYIIRDNLISGGSSYKNLFDGISNKAIFITGSDANLYTYIKLLHPTDENSYPINNVKVMLVEGDYSNKEISHFEGLQSSFEEKINDEGKYEIEIISNNRNLFDLNKLKDANNWNVIKGQPYHYIPIRLKPNTTYKIHCKQINSSSDNGTFFGIFDEPAYFSAKRETLIWASSKNKDITFTTDDRTIYYWNVYFNVGFSQSKITELFEQLLINVQMEENTKNTNYIPHKQNKIKLLINEPLRAVDNAKDRLCIKNGKLVVERNCKQVLLNGTQECSPYKNREGLGVGIRFNTIDDVKSNSNSLCDTMPTGNLDALYGGSYYGVATGKSYNCLYIVIPPDKVSGTDLSDGKIWLQSNPVTVVYITTEPTYEEVLNEYGEPIMLEGYENGTIYIDSAIVPTTSVRYTPKMQSFKTLKEIENNNIMLTNDVNDNIIPYMMDVDLMIMEKEMALMNQYKIRRVGAKDMTSMQKRTQDMLERLIKGKTLTEQECKTRVTTYLNAGKITETQKDELMLLISEVYA